MSARRALAESMETFRDQEDAYFSNIARSQLAEITRLHGDHDEALRLYREVVPFWQQTAHVGGLARCFECMAFIAAAQARGGDDDARLTRLTRAGQLLGAAEMLRRDSGAVMLAEERAEYEREVADLRAQMQVAQLEQAWSQGRALSLDQAIAFARSG